jgi:hypothetical protein
MAAKTLSLTAVAILPHQTLTRFTMNKLSLTFVALAFSAFPALAQDVPVVTNPATGEEVAVTDIDMSTLTDEQIADIKEQVAAIREDRQTTMEQTRERTRERAGDMGAAAAGTGGGMGGGAGGPGGGAGGPGRP